jgi:hypothetical protein
MPATAGIVLVSAVRPGAHDPVSRGKRMPAFAGMTGKGAGMTIEGAGMTGKGAGMTIEGAGARETMRA